MKLSLKFNSQDKDILISVLRFAKARKAKLYLVGGFLRDMVAGRRKENPDFDFALKRGAISFGKLLAKKMKAGFVILDREHGACRVVVKTDTGFFTLDFTDFRGPTLEEDLLHRDFTVNSLAISLEDALTGQDLDKALIDLYGARLDIKKKIIRIVHRNAFREDPLRILRAFSLASIFKFDIDKATLKLAAQERTKLAKVSSERIRDELFKIFATDNVHDFFLQLDKLKILEVIFPQIKKMRGIGQGPYHHLDVWQHTLETMSQLDALFKAMKTNQDIRDYLDQEICLARKRSAIIKFASFLHDFGKPKTLRREKNRTTFHGHERVGKGMTREISKGLKLSNDEIHALEKIVLWHLRPGYLGDFARPTARAKFRFFRDAGSEAIATLLLSIADQRATKGPLSTNASRRQHERIVFGMIREHFKRSKQKTPERLVNGDEIMQKFALEPSPLVGKILREIEELQAIGAVKTKEEALKRAAKFIP